MFRVLFFVSSSVVVTDLTSPIYHGFQGTQHLFSTFLSNVLFGIMTPLDTTGPTLSTVKVLRVILVCPRMKSTARYHLKDNLRVSINQRLSLTERVARANAIRVARDYTLFRNSLNIKLKD
jgi:hypothetical protein